MDVLDNDSPCVYVCCDCATGLLEMLDSQATVASTHTYDGDRVRSGKVNEDP